MDISSAIYSDAFSNYYYFDHVVMAMSMKLVRI